MRHIGNERSSGRIGWITLAVLTVVAVVLRLPEIGNPVHDVDEQFYLVTADHMLRGEIPYVDVWDRKPIGLFLIYAAIRMLGGEGVAQYQAVASLFALATSLVIVVIARRSTASVSAAAAGVIYLVWLSLLGGSGGQSPVFFNLFTALAGWAATLALETTDPRALRRLGDRAMLAMGIAMQIKPTTMPEGALFGLTFLYLAWRTGMRTADVVAFGARLVAIAAAPLFAALLVYSVLQHADAFWFANFVSIFRRMPLPRDVEYANLTGIMLAVLPLGVAAIAGLSGRWSHMYRGNARLVAAWLASSTLAFLLLPPYYNHYSLPLLVPLSLASAFAFDLGLIWRAIVAAAAIGLLHASGFNGDVVSGSNTRMTQRELARVTAIVGTHLGTGCLFVFEGPPIIYHSVKACAPTRFLFPNHLNRLPDAQALDVDPAAEVVRIMATKPSVVLATNRRNFPDPNPKTWSVVEAALAKHYERVGVTSLGSRVPIEIYARR